MSKKEREPKFRQKISTPGKVIPTTETTLRDEVDYVCKLASKGDCQMITMNELVFFSTPTRDAWMLDWEDKLAICLMKAGALQPCEFAETKRKFGIHWQGHFAIEGEFFCYTDNKTPLSSKTIYGYPTEAISATMEQLQRRV